MRLFLLMAIVTAIEVVLISKVGSLIGFWWTLFIIIFTAFLGSRLLGKQWRFVIGKMQSLQGSPSDALLEALVLVIVGVLLITPGFLTDIIGFLGLVPKVREGFVAFLKKHNSKLMQGGLGGFQMHSSTSYEQQTDASQGFRQGGRDSQVIEGEFERKDN